MEVLIAVIFSPLGEKKMSDIIVTKKLWAVGRNTYLQGQQAA